MNTIHSAKGCALDVVSVIHVSDGILPSDMATGDADQIEEEQTRSRVPLWPLRAITPRRWKRTLSASDSRATPWRAKSDFLSVRSSALAASDFMAAYLS